MSKQKVVINGPIEFEVEVTPVDVTVPPIPDPDPPTPDPEPEPEPDPSILKVSAEDPKADFKSLKEVNEYTPQPGETIAFRRGEVFNGTLNPKRGGENDKWVTFGVYDEGSRPIIRGASLDFKQFIKLYGINIDGQGVTDMGLGMYGSQDIVVDNMVVQNTKRNNIFIGPARNIEITRSVVRKTQPSYQNTHCIYLSGESGPSLSGIKNVLISGCDISEGDSAGIQMNGNGDKDNNLVRDVRIVANKIHHNEMGIADYSSDGLLVLGNIFFNNKGIEVYNDRIGDSITSRNGEYFHNTFYNVNPGWGELIGFYQADNYKFVNNIVFGGGKSAYGFSNRTKGFQSSNNLLSVRHYVIDGKWYTNLKDVQNRGYEIDSIVGDPKFVDLTGFELSPDSPAIDTGKVVLTDYQFVGDAPDIGAKEFGR